MTEKQSDDTYNIRIHTTERTADLEAIMARVGSEWPGVARMVPKAVHFVVEVQGVRTPAALILKEEMLSKGGDAAIHRDCITGRVERSNVILMGSEKVYRSVIASLHAQPFSLRAIAGELKSAIDRFELGFSVPDVPEGPVRRLYETMAERTVVMGILNVTPDSFSDGGLHPTADAGVEHARRMVEEGADIIDIGGESSRPGAEPVSAEDEMVRILPVIERLASEGILISVDTYKPDVARTALDAGAQIVNDITGLADPAMIDLVAERKCPAVMMHMKGTPQTMQQEAVYEDVTGEVMAYFRERIGRAAEAGVLRDLLIIDPGIGFAKTAEHNMGIIRNLADFKTLGLPILIGTSRKRFIGAILGDLPAHERIEGTAATVAVSIANGANVVRVHDVKEMSRVAQMTDAIVRG